MDGVRGRWMGWRSWLGLLDSTNLSDGAYTLHEMKSPPLVESSDM